jgi:hypothetical protein
MDGRRMGNGLVRSSETERPEHNPIGNPCVLCRQPALSHRVDHDFKGGARVKCLACGLPLENHRLRMRADVRQRRERKQKARNQVKMFLGLDGEGQGRRRHKYVLLAASDETGEKQFKVENRDGLSAEECLTFIYELPARARLFTYSFGYDWTKILQSLTETPEGKRALFLLFRPELRQRFGPEGRKGPWPVIWKGWLLNLQGTKFSLSRAGAKKARKRIIWDIWKFYQSKFTSALDDWKVGTPEERALILRMKDKRAEFDKESPENVQKYCFLECQKMAELARRLIDAHQAAGLPLKTFYGAGSTASVMLDQMGVRRHIEKILDEMRDPVARAFSGGRFEVGAIGSILGHVNGWDISSAYPYQCCKLPCLVHGKWELTKSRERFERAKWGLVHYRLRKVSKDILERPWGPFPFRFPKGHKEAGSICYPSLSGGGWVYQDEYRAAEKLFPQVEFIEAWVFTGECECMPFMKIPQHYCERCRIGKEGPGIVLKLGCNSCYGKLAQSVGNGQFNCWIWAGMITSGCRAQGLELLGLHQNWDNLLMFATDGLLTRETIAPPHPIETGTGVTGKPLGGWENKPFERGVFLARPGVYFPLNPTDADIKTLRGRGVGRSAILENWKRIVDAWERRKRGEWPVVELDNISRFCGAKTSISRVKRNGVWKYKVASGNHLKGAPRYGEWITRKVEMSFNPLPKRDGATRDGRLLVRQLPTDLESAPYDKAVLSEEAKQLILLAAQVGEQPDGDLGEYEME